MEPMDLGTRIKRVRKTKGLTLKDVEGRSRVSATHISEIERGKTSPTINALARIAVALGKDTAFFLETQSLEDVCRIKFEDREQMPFKTTAGFFQPLTHGIPGGQLQVYRIHLEPNGSFAYVNPAQDSEATLICSRGDLDFEAEGETYRLAGGDSVHFSEGSNHRIANASASEGLDLVLISTRRYSLDDI